MAEVTEAVKGTVNRVSGAIEAGRKPGMPLSILSNIAREAPLGSLLVAFLLGVAVARRRLWSGVKLGRRGYSTPDLHGRAPRKLVALETHLLMSEANPN